MRDIDIMTNAMAEAHAVLCDYIEPDRRDPAAVLQQMIEILDRDDVVAARERLSKGYGHLRVVK
ncbi:hypothetical protein RPMA_18245 [Tardiphaga alba]|uniref:Uncharacterized protein n=1 Tax=Tardiphaga alba TaxID=340268 RepID=A0ABX8A9W7_9BRAD|nr:hypothetical protein [Tardiphaga alba]QUS40559.1 hypothetical protein RPMA_18245 [Tardiphaga alba]